MLKNVDCIESTYHVRKSDGYSRIWWEGRGQMAHRVAWELENGPIPKNMTVDHVCKNRSCVNPDHMEIVTLSENIKRSKSFNKSKDFCPKGHAYKGKNLYVRPNGWRYCVECVNASSLRYYHRKKVI